MQDVKNYRPEGHFTTGLLDWIAAIPESNRGVLVQVGVWRGDGTLLFAPEFRQVIDVDPWQGETGYEYNMDAVYVEYCERTWKIGNLSRIRATSAKAAPTFKDESVDVVYIDAQHKYEAVKEDIMLWLPKVKRGGHIGGHDYHEQFPGVIQAVTEAFGEVQTFADGSWLKGKE